MPRATINEALDLAAQYQRDGRLGIAEQIYRQILQQRPDHAQSHYFLGKVLRDTGRVDEAMSLFRQAIALRPDYLDAHNALGAVLANRGILDEAIAEFHQVISMKPDCAEVFRNLGIVLAAKRDSQASAAAYEKAIALKPNFHEALVDFGDLRRDQARFDEAMALYRRAIDAAPDYAEAYNSLGVILRYRRLPDEAMALFRRAIALRPNYAEAHSNLGLALADTGCIEAGVAEMRKAVSLAPDFESGHTSLVYALHFHPAFDARAIAEEHRNWNHCHAEPLKPRIKPHQNERDPERRLRVGYISPDFRDHPVGRFLLPLLQNHDHADFEIFIYSGVLFPDATTKCFERQADSWRNIASLTNAHVADLIREDRIDILVELTLHMAYSRLLVFAEKPAPVQVTYLSYAGTSGLNTIDYRLSDPYLDPPRGDESVYSEKTFRLPETYWCYQPVTDIPLVLPPATKNGFVTFGCLNNFWKVNEPLLDLWAQILFAVKNSKLVLHAHEGSHRQRVSDFLNARGIEPSRVGFSGSLSAEAYFELYQSIDIALDTAPYGGGTTTCDALWMGVPVVTLAGKTAVGRGGASILSNIGLTELIANRSDEYVQLASSLANDLPRLSHLRSTLRSRMQVSPLMDATGFTRGIESAYRQMWQSWCGKPNP